MAEYDGSVIIKTALETDGFRAGSQDLKRAAQEAANNIENISAATRASIDKQVRNFDRLNDAYNQQEQQIEALRAQYEELASSQVESAEYSAVNAEIAKLDKQLDEAANKVDKMVALYGQAGVEGKASFQGLQYDIEQMNERYDQLIAKRTEMEETGTAYVSADASAAQRQLAAAEEKHHTALEKLNDSYLTLRDRINSVGKEGVKAHTATAKHTGISFKKILQYGFGIRSVFALFRRLRNAAKESLGVMAQYDPELNKTVSKFMTSAKQLKADMGTVLQPLIQKLAPIVTALLDRIHDGLIAISQFFAALVGQNYIEVATVATVDWAGSLNDVADAAQKVEKSLGSYDKLNVISSSAEDEAKAAKNNMQLTKDTVKYTKQALDNDKWYVKLGRSLSGVFQSALDWLKKQMEDPEKFLTTLGVSALAIKLGQMLLGGIGKSGFGTGLSGLLPKVITVAVVAVIGYKIGQKIYNSLPEGLQDELADTVGGYVEAYEEGGLAGAAEHFVEEVDYVREEAVDALADAMYDAATAKPEIKRRWSRTEQEIDDRIREQKKQQEEVYKNSLKYAKQQERYHNQISGYYERLKEERQALVDNGKAILKGVDKAFKDKHGVSILDIGTKFLQANRGAADKIKTTTESIASGIGSVFKGVTRTIMPTLKVQDFVDETGEKLKAGFSNILTAAKGGEIGERAKAIGTTLKGAIVNAFGFTKQDETSAQEKTARVIKTIGSASSVKVVAAGAGETIASALAASIKYTDAQKKGVKDRTSGLLDGQETQGAVAAGNKLAAALLGAFKFSEANIGKAKVETGKLTDVTGAPETAAKTNGKDLAGTLADNFTFTKPQIAKAKIGTAELAGTTGAPETAAKTGGRSLITSLLSAFTFTDKDKKDSASSLAEGLNGVANEAGRSGSALYNALKGIGQKISEGINKGTVSVPVTFAGTSVPKGTALQNAVNKINNTVTIQLDGKTISEVVFDEAGKKAKQLGSGAAAIVKFLSVLGGT